MSNAINTNTMKTFKTGNTYKMNWIGDSELKTFIKIVKRTAKQVTIQDVRTKEEKRCKINVYDGAEYIFPTGRYSMAPTLNAKNVCV
jgi:hypothetical protein